ncbi:TIGR04197 family type VII secretion effector [Xylocopilactobacillus apicola]|uniref:TIGR04197 family type VII secretion effector n=1 Tax=Xylocopilactobacillus apicola TaxID=2932184 RepID=A0AAU9DAL0_9LACO|nr:TIGR04197 family type VII secretion effector [Xylocopilactobacillus apicola]BDR59420.1 hypothetical protein XA3_18610 [Xylocopilactobacillus apicola]
MDKIASNETKASSAITGLTNVQVNHSKQVSLGRSNITGMKTGTEVNNQILKDISKLVQCVKTQGGKFKQIAAEFNKVDNKIKF